ncbi:MAG: hypothetical protein DIU79_09820 [Actinobacteria bacterium]|nr:MAG: hypothetical protein DIU79_09820 [Actinomycetota bacterium]
MAPPTADAASTEQGSLPADAEDGPASGEQRGDGAASEEGAEAAPSPDAQAGGQPTQADDQSTRAGETSATGDTSGYVYRYTDPATGQPAQAVIPDAYVERALSLMAWAENLPQQTRDAIGMIESGQAVVIPRADYDQFVAWKNQQDKSQRDADLSNLDVDPDVAKLISELRDKVATLEAQQQQGGVDPQYQAQANAELSALNREIAAAQHEYAQTRGLTAEEAEALMATAVQAEVIPIFMQQYAVRNPVTGALLQYPDMRKVTEAALDFALTQHPNLHEKVIAARQNKATPTAGATPSQPEPAQSEEDRKVAAKKARAASLATAPSGAVAPPPATVKSMSEHDRIMAMAREIEQALAAS